MATRKNKNIIRNTPLLDQMIRSYNAQDNRKYSNYGSSQEQSNNDPFSPISNRFGIDWDNVQEEYSTPLSHLWSMMIERLAGSNVDYDDDRLRDVSKQREDLAEIAVYKHNLSQLDTLQQEYNKKLTSGNLSASESTEYLEQINDLQNQIRQSENYFMGPGRQSDVVVDMLYDKSKTSWYGDYLKSKRNITPMTENLGFWGRTGDAASYLLSEVQHGILDPVAYAVDRIMPSWLGGKKKGDWQKDIIKNIPQESSDPYFNDLIQRSFAGREKVASISQDDLTAKDQELTDSQEQLKVRRQIDEDLLKTGKWHPLYIGSRGIKDFSFNISNPDAITEEDRERQESVESFWSPTQWKYAIPELGSSISMMHYSLGSVVADATLGGVGGYLERKLPVWIGKAAVNSLKGVSLAVAAENIAMSREMETSMEAIQARTDRILDTAMKNGADLARVGKVIRDRLQEVDPDRDLSNMKPEDYVRAALSFNIQTGDEKFDTAVKQSEKGLNQLINANNALRVADYLELMPFMNFGGSVASDLASKAFHGVGDRIYRYGGKVFTSKTAEELEKMALPHIRGAYSKIVDVAASKVIGDGNNVLKNVAALKGSRLAKSLGSFTTKTTGVGISESLEEGVQELLQARYARGQYDDYDGARESFSIPEMFNTWKLAGQATLDYFGLNPNDPENGSSRIKKAMNVGAAAGIMMSNAYSATPGVVKAVYNTATGNPFDQTKSDISFAKMIADDFQNAQDNRHLQIYYDMLHSGRKPQSVIESLNTFKNIAQADNTLVQPDYVERDIKLAKVMSALYSDNKFNEAVQRALGVSDNKAAGKPGTEEHREALVQTAKTFIDVEDAYTATLQGSIEHVNLMKQRQQIVDELLSDNISEERKRELQESNPKLVELITKYIDQYNEILPTDKNKRISNLLNDLDSLLKNRHIRFAVRSELEKDNNYNTVKALEDDVDKRIKDLFDARNIINSPSANYLNNLINEAVENETIDKNQYVRKQLNQLERYHNQQRLQSLRDMFSNQAGINKLIRKVTGTDIDPNRTLGLRDKIQEQIDRLETDPNTGKKISIDPTVLSIFEGQEVQNSFFDDQDAVDEAVKNNALNGAVASTLNDILNVYKSKMSVAGPAISIGGLSAAIFGRNGNPDAELQALVEKETELNTWLNAEGSLNSQERTSKSLADERIEKETEKADAISKTFDWLVKRSAQLPEQRRYVAHKSVIDGAEDIVEQTVQEQQVNSNVDSQEQTPTVEQTPIDITTQEQAPEPILEDEVEPIVEQDPEPQTIIEDVPEYQTEPQEQEDYQSEAQEEYQSEDTDGFVTVDEAHEGRQYSDEDPDVAKSNDTEEYQPDDIEEYQSEDKSDDYQGEDAGETPFFDFNDFRYEDLTVSELDGIFRIFYAGKEITDDNIKKRILAELRLLNESDQFQNTQNIADGGNSFIVSPKNVGSVISETFFFEPNPAQDENGEDKIVAPVVGDKPIELKYKQYSGRELSKKLSTKGWLNSKTTNVYYVVGRPKRLTSKDALVQGADVRDALQIAMVIEDNSEQKSYVTYLRSLGNYSKQDDQPAVDEEKILRVWMRSKSADWSKIGSGITPETQSARVSAYNKAYDSLFESKLKAQYRIDKGIDPDKNTHSKEVYQSWRNGIGLTTEESATRAAIIDRISLITQQELAQKNASLITNSQINKQIEDLRNFRNKIITEYLGETFDIETMSAEYKNSVKPVEVSQSNGRFNNQKESEFSIMPKVFKIISGTVEQIQNTIKSGKLQIGIGRGFFGNPQFGIFNPLNIEEIFTGKGLSGKVYQLLEGPGTRQNIAPAMLIEERFLTQLNKNGKSIPLGDLNTLHICLDDKGRIDPNAGEWLPSAAEVLLHMLCNRVEGIQTVPEMVEFFLHNGEKTILNDQDYDSRSSIMNSFASKQIEYDPSTDKLRIAIQNGDKYELKTYDCRQLFLDPDAKRVVVHAIATQMHWNTEKEFLQSTITVGSTDALSSFISSLMNKFRDKNKPLSKQRISILGCPQLSFDTSDFINDDGSAKENVSVLAWTIKEGKVYTDIDPKNQFKDPYVFASGVKTVNTEEKVDIDEQREVKQKPKIKQQIENISERGQFARDLKTSLKDFANSIAESMRNFLGLDKNGELSNEKWLALSEEEHDKFESSNKTLKDRFILVPYSDPGSRNAEESYNRILEYVGKVYSDSFREDVLKNLDDKKEEILKKLSDERKLNDFNKGKSIIMIEITKKGLPIISYLPMSGVGSNTMRYYATSGMKFTGIFSNRRAKGRSVNIETARKWINETLGLGEDQVILADAYLKSMYNDNVFGLTQMCIDSLSKDLLPAVLLRQDGEYGIEYHEAFHIVNLLLHDGKQRSQIYKNFVSNNKWAENLKLSQIEEILADRFMDYMLGYDKTTSTRIGRFFRNIWEFVIIGVSHKDSYRSLFRKIRKGGYANVELDKQSVEEFQKLYPYGAQYNKFHIQGTTDEQLAENMPNIPTAFDFYAATNAIVNSILRVYDFRTLENIQNLKMSMQDIYDVIDGLIAKCDNTYLQSQLTDLKSKQNEQILLDIFAERLNDIGIKVTDLQKESSSVSKREKSNENAWDRFQYEFSRKDNATSAVKLLLATVPQQIKLPDGSYVDDVDEYGATKLFDQTEVYTTLIKRAWDCTSLDKMNGNEYDTHALMGIITTHAETTPMFHTLLNILNASDDSNIKSQLYTTISSSLQNIEFLQIKDPKSEFTGGYGEDEAEEPSDLDAGQIEVDQVINDRERIWEFLGDRNLRVAKKLPREWSSNLVMNGLVSTDRTKISDRFKTDLKNLFEGNSRENITGFVNLATNLYNLSNTPNVDNNKLQEDYDVAKEALREVLKKLSIPVDTAVLNAFIYAKAGAKNVDLKKKIEALYKLATEVNNGSLKEVVQTIIKSSYSTDGQLINSFKSSYKYSLNEILNSRPETSDIGLLAISYNDIHPSQEELSVIDPNGNRLYPVSQNNHQTAKIRKLNTERSAYTEQARKYKYSAHSMLLDAADKVDPNDPDSQIKISLFVGLKDGDRAEGADYFGITAREDIISKMFLTERSILGLGRDQLIDPTMADKKGFLTFSSPYINLYHHAYLLGQSKAETKKAIINTYTKMHQKEYDDIQAIKDPMEKLSQSSAFNKRAYDNYKELLQMAKDNALILQEDIDAFEKYNNEIKNLSAGTQPITLIGGKLRFNLHQDVINRFIQYFSDELEALIQYYDSENIKYLSEHPTEILTNYHGDLKNSRIQFGGNAGLMRYMYDVIKYEVQDPENPGKTKFINLNQYLNALWELQKKIENGEVENTKPNGEKYVGTNNFENPLDLDGFELIREELARIKQKYDINVLGANEELQNNINDWLIDKVDYNLDMFSTPGSQLQLGIKTESGVYSPSFIPEQLLVPYLKQMEKLGATNPKSPYNNANDDSAKSSAFISLITNFTVNQMISTLEVEKVITGDPAFFKYGKLTDDKRKPVKEKVEISYNGPISSGKATVDVDIINDMFGDKVKRLGSSNSPGEEIRLFYNQEEISKDPTLASPLYTVLDMEDVETESLYKDMLEERMTRQSVSDYVRHQLGEGIQKFISEYSTKNNLDKNAAIEQLSSAIYIDDDIYKNVYDVLTEDQKAEIRDIVKHKIKPYREINVVDAQTIISPSLYRRIRIGLGQWTGDIDLNSEPEEGTDEWAYRILEKNDNWMKDPNLSKAIKHFEVNVLKTIYVQNDPHLIGSVQIVLPELYKMAMFPLFKFHRSSSVGRQLYERMNNEELGRIDMLAFKSAVKVGAKKYAFDPGKGQEDKLLNVNQELMNPSSHFVEYENNKIIPTAHDNPLAVKVLSLENLRMQLNTHSHEDEERSIGTQILKIAFSNILPFGQYKDVNGNMVEGREIISQIMKYVNAMTKIGADEINSQFKPNGETVDQDAVVEFLRKIVKNNNLGFYADEILEGGGTIQSLSSSSVFEQSIAAKINRSVIDIPTNGGSAIQQSQFGLSGYSIGSSIKTDDKYTEYNDGKKLRWIKDDNTLEVMLSIKFFYSVIPSYYRNRPFTEVRQYLIDRGYINGHKSDRRYYGEHEIFDKQVDGLIINLPNELYAEIKSDDSIKTVGDLWKKRGKFKKHSKELNKLFDNLKITSYEVSSEFSEADKPFGIGYRIPTQGMSSAFAFTVADVLPEEVGDLIVVPEEFTAQTGSDYDIDKIYLATLAYKDNKLELFDEDNPTKIGASNSLLQTYINILTDPKNFSLARGSIDVLTSRIKNDFVKKVLRAGNTQYSSGGIQLTPAFQAMRKAEFVTGKSGISIFALAITNLALTQATGLSLLYNENVYSFGDLDEIQGKDMQYISDWLSAMVNAHVDVAKDAYVFDINVNQFTYNHTAFLIRAGKGMGTFTFLAQPILVEYAMIMNNSAGIYGKNVDSEDQDYQKDNSESQREYKHMLNKYAKWLEYLLKDPNVKYSEQDIKYLKFYAEYARAIAVDKMKIKENYGNEEAYKNLMDQMTTMFFNGTYGHPYEVFVEDLGIQNIEIWMKKAKIINGRIQYDNKDAIDVAKMLAWQIRTVIAYSDTTQFADQLSELVHLSQVDTKKFGNTIPTIYNYRHRIFSFISDGNSWVSHNIPADGPISPLEYYFDSTWLMDKLDTAYNLMLDILSNQTFDAQNIYKDIFVAVAKMMFGGKQIYASKFNEQYTGYNPIKSEKDVLLIAQMLNSVLQFNSLFYSNPDQLISDYGVDVNSLDLSFGGNVDLLYENIRRILFGDDKQKNLFQRTNDLLKEIAESDDFIYDDLKDGDKIANEFLNFIYAVPPTTKRPIGRIALRAQLSRTTESKRKRLSTAVDQLLNHDSEKVRNWMRDMAIYAYYAYNNSNRYDSFLELIPFQYRKSFDMSVKDAILKMNSKDVNLDYLGIVSTAEGIDATDIFDVICRNNWRNDRLVPVKQPIGNQYVFNTKRGSAFLQPFLNASDGQKYHKAIILQDVAGKASTLYIKGPRGQLYRRSGKITIGEGKNKYTKSIYLPTEKAGLNNQFQEMWAKFGIKSMFDQNALSEQLQEKNTIAYVEDVIKNTNVPEGVQLSLVWDINADKISHVQEKQSLVEKSNTTVTAMRPYPVRGNAEIQAKRNADIIIQLAISSNVSVDDIEKDNSLQGKTILLDVTNPAGFQEQFNQMIENLDRPKIHISTILYDSQLSQSLIQNEDSAIEDSFTKLYSEYKARPRKGNPMTREQFKQFKEGKYYNIAKRDVAVRKLYNTLLGVLGSIKTLPSFSVTITQQKSMPAKVVSVINNIISSRLGNAASYDSRLYVNKTYARSMDFRKQVNILNATISRLSSTVASQEDADLLEEQLKLQQENERLEAEARRKQQEQEKQKSVIKYHNGIWKRREAITNPKTLYIFTDNTDRNSGKKLIDPNSNYAAKYGSNKHYPESTQAVLRGLNNAMPISTMRYFYKDHGISMEQARWTDENFEEFKQVIDSEINDIIEEWNTGKYDYIMFAQEDGLFNTNISDINSNRTPKIYSYLNSKIQQLQNTIQNAQKSGQKSNGTQSIIKESENTNEHENC